MLEYLPQTHKKLFFFVFITCCLVLTIFYYDNTLINYNVFSTETTSSYTGSNFIVWNSKCHMIDMDPFNRDAMRFFHPEKYQSCTKLELLTYITKQDNTATLHVDKEIVPSYSASGVNCCYSNVTRTNSSTSPDGSVSVSKCVYFDNNVTLHHDVIMVKCTNAKNKKHQVYENVHAPVVINPDVQKKIDKYNNTTKPLSVLFVGIDSISRLNFIRSLPNTYRYVEDHRWLSLKGYNKMDDNTFPNLMAILTGFNQSHAYSVCNPRELGHLDDCPMLWYDFKNLGYITAYAEDQGSINTFNYRKKGFRKPPSDYYFRPYILASEKLTKVSKDRMTYCTGPETGGERIMNIAKDFAITLKDYPTFGFFWMNSFSHNDLNSATGMDNKVRGFLEDLTSSGTLENSIVIFLSDHGMRFGPIRVTETGWLEERLPFIYLSFPEWFKEKYPKEINNFVENSRKLTSPYDLHMTLKHILVMSGHNFTVKQADACPKCLSLFEEVPQERSCEDAGITQHWCTCAGYTNIALDGDVEEAVSKFVIGQIDEIIRSNEGSDSLCAKYSIAKIISSSLSHPFVYKKDTYLLLKFETSPEAVFETTIRYRGELNKGNYTLSGGISRLDSYSDHSTCVSDAYLKMFCYCRS